MTNHDFAEILMAGWNATRGLESEKGLQGRDLANALMAMAQKAQELARLDAARGLSSVR